MLIVTIKTNFFYTHCGRYKHTLENCWDLNSWPGNISTTPAEVEHLSGSNEQNASSRVDSQSWKDELTIIRDWLH